MISRAVKYVIVFALAGFTGRLLSQPDLEFKYHKKDVHLPSQLTKDPVVLAEALTADKSSETEKFTAIFSWVASNIRYNFRTYYSSNGAGKPNIKRMLRYRSGICMDYATLMDTLCELAGITNVSIYGYAKDEIFDVHDSIYVDNHAWNAVKLDGQWYVYDVTWASGDRDYKFTAFSSFIVKLGKRFPEKYKRKKVKKRNSYFFIDECGTAFSSPAYYYKQKFFNRLARNLIGRFRLKVKQYYTQKINPAFYLTNPELFAVTHFPDNPDWSLVSSRSMRNFETDSAFYHLADSTYLHQERGGRSCPDCDYDKSLQELNKQHYLLKKSFGFNRRNRFITSFCEYTIAAINFDKSREQEDSLTKVGLLDTSIAYLQKAKTGLRISFRNIDTDFLLQKNKNKHKQMLLLNENRNNIHFIKEKINVTMVQKRSMKSLDNKCDVNLRKYKRRRGSIRRLKSEITPDPRSRLSEKEAEQHRIYLEEKERQVDSLTALIEVFKIRMDSVLTNLSLNVWQKVLHHDSLVVPILESTDLRKLLSDNLKKPVVEVRKKIPEYKRNYQLDINQVVYTPAMNLTDFGTWLLNLVDARNNYENDCFHSKLLLVKFNRLPLSALSDYKEMLLNQNRLDYCWLKAKLAPVKATYTGFDALRNRQTVALNVIVAENEVERQRTHYVSKELLRRKKKYRHIVINNLRVANVKLIEVRKEKRSYLNQLKKERRKAAKANRKQD